jgi:flagellar biosynthesis/type III secretory pathway protein FliH
MIANLQLSQDEIERISNLVLLKMNQKTISDAITRIIQRNDGIESELRQRLSKLETYIKCEVNKIILTELDQNKKDIQMLIKEELKCQMNPLTK